MGEILDDAIGFSIEIPEKVFTDLTKLDDKIAGLQKTANDAADNVINSFLSIGNEGIKSLVNKIGQLNDGISKLNLIDKLNLSKPLEDTSISAEDLANNMIKVVDSLNKLGVGVGNIAELKKQIKNITDLLEKDGGISDQSRQQLLVDIRRHYQEQLKIATTSNQEIAAAELAADEKRYQEKLKYYDKIQKAEEKKESDKYSRMVRNIAAQNKIFEAERKLEYATSYKGSLDYSKNAKSINEEVTAIKYLTEARNKLKKTDSDYSAKLVELSNAIKKHNKSIKDTIALSKEESKTKQHVMDINSQIARRLALIFSVSQITSYLLKLRDVRAEFELQNKSLEVLLKSKLDADRLFNQISQLAVQSPFTVKELVTYTKQLAAYQVEEKELYKTTKMLADVSAGLGVDMNRLILAFGQVKAANFLKGTEVRQFSEAGLNVLGELSKYYTELEGRMVSVAEVQEMVTKRMVSFGDVQEVFRRVTSEGGLFYKMQEKQAETLAGQISNLKDRFYLMLNDIGKANDGVLKGFVGTVKSIVENWRTLEAVLKAVGAGMAVYVAKTVAATIQTNRLLASTNALEKQMGAARVAAGIGTSKWVTKLTGAFKGLFSVLKANPYAIAASLAMGLGTAIYNNYKRIKEAREEYEKFSIETEKTASKIDGIRKEIESVSTEISNYKNTLNGLQEGTDEYKEVQSKLNDKIKTQTELFNQLKTDYPEIYAGLVNQKAGTEELSTATEEYVKQLRQAILLNNLLSDDAGKKRKDIKLVAESYAEASEEIDNLNSIIESEYLRYYNAIQKALLDPNFAAKYGENLNKIFESDKSYYEKLLEFRQYAVENSAVRTNKYVVDVFNKALWIGDYRRATKQMINQTELLDKSVQSLIDNVLVLAGVISEEDFMKLPEDEKNSYIESIRSFINEIPSIQNEAVKKFVFDKIKVSLGIELDEKEIPAELGNVQKRINAYIKKYNLESKNVIELITFDKTPDAYFEDLAEKYKLLTTEEQRLKTATEERNEEGTNKERLKIVQQELANIKKISEAFGYGDKLLTKSGKKNEDDLNKWRDKLNLITKAYNEYKKYIKLYGEESSAELVRQNLKQSFENQGIGNILATMSFDPSGIIEALMIIYNMAGKKLEKEVQTAIDNVSPDIALNIKLEEVDKIRSEIDNLFSQYDLASTLKKEGVDESLIKQLFGVEIFNVDDLRNALAIYRASFDDLGETQIEIFENAEKKITGIQNNETKERMKLYVSLLKKSVSERINIELEAQDEINKVWQDTTLTPTQKTSIANNIIEQMQRELDSLSWDEFKGSNTYVSLFEDIETASDTALKVMRDRLLQVRESLKNLDPSDLKEILKRLEEIDDELIERNPFAKFGEDVRTYISYLKERNKLERKYANSVAKEDQISGQIKDIEKSIIYTNQLYDTYALIFGIDDGRTIKIREQLDNEQSILNNLREQLEVQQDITSETENQIREGEKSKLNLVGSLSEVSQIINSLTSAIPEIASNLENVFGEMSQKTSDILDTTVGIIDGVGTTTEGVMNIISGDKIQGIIQVISGLTKIIGESFAAGDKAIEWQIQAELDKIELLEERYEDLKEEQEKVFRINQINAYQRSVEDALESEIEALESAIALEKSKKKSNKDSVDEYTKQLEEAKDKLEGERKSYLEERGSVVDPEDMKSLAEDFVSSWLDAFLETGDGLVSLKENFNEFFDNIVVKQVALRFLSGYLKPFIDDINKMLTDYKEGYITESEFKEGIADKKDEVEGSLDRMNEALKIFFGSWGYTGGELATPELSGLTKGIQSITEETALALESLLNAMRNTMMEDNVTLKNILISITSQDAVQNPILGELKTHTKLITDIRNMFTSIITPSQNSGGKCIRISM